MANSALAVMKCLFLLAIVSLCTVAQSPHYELLKKSMKWQAEHKEIWDRLVKSGEITSTNEWRLQRKGSRPLYKFTGNKVMNMKLDEVFSMLQNYLEIITVSTDTFFEIPIGGEIFTFRLRKGRHGQILVGSAKGRLESYSKIQNVLDGAESAAKSIAKQILQSLNEPLNAQSTWTENDATVREKMRLFLVITQVAEAAPLSEEFFSKVQKNIADRTSDWESKSMIKLLRKIRGKSGRDPAAAVVVQNILEHMVNGEIGSFKDLGEIFVNSRKGGAQAGREMWFKSNGGYENYSQWPEGRRAMINEHSFKRQAVDENLSKRRTVDPEAVATSDALESETTEAIKASSGCNSRKRKKRSSACDFQRKVVPDSIEFHEGQLKFETVEENGVRKRHQVRLKSRRVSLVEYMKERIAHVQESGVVEKLGRDIAIYGALVNSLASINYFLHGEIGKGTLSAFQATHGLGGHLGTNDYLSKVTGKALRKVVTATAEKILSKKVLQQLSEAGEKALGKALGRFAGSFSFVGFGLDVYFVIEDIKELKDKNSSVPKPLRVTHLIIDSALAVLSFIPPAQPLTLALSIVRLGLDDFYVDIKEELAKVKGKDFWSKVAAFEQGISNGIFDFITLKLGRQMRLLGRQQSLDSERLQNLSNPVSYFNVTIQGVDSNSSEVKTLIDFNAGMKSPYGGFLTVKLNDNGSVTVQMPEVFSESGVPYEVTKTLSFDHPVTDIVLGVGQVANPVYRQGKAMLWLLIKVKTYDIVDHFEKHPSSQYGRYYGNSRDNTFYALQGRTSNNSNNSSSSNNRNKFTHKKRQPNKSCSRITDSITLRLQSYHYELYGREGSDRFFLGPQSSLVTGGDDNDIYYIPASGGSTTINNYAHDEEMDTLFMNVSYSDIACTRDRWDLVIAYCESHAVKIKNWFSHGLEKFHRHIFIHTADGIVVEANKMDLHNGRYRVECVAVAIDKSQSSSGQDLVLTESFSHVKQAIGSNYSDTIVGNHQANILNGGRSGHDRLEGKNGLDLYIVGEGSGLTEIFNFAEDNKEDILIISIPYTRIGVGRDNFHLLLNDLLDNNGTKVSISNWFSGTNWQHMLFTSRDLIQFKITEDSDGVIRKHPFIIDLRGSANSVYLNLARPNSTRNISINSEVAKEVQMVFDSPYDDVIIGNALDNILGCSGGSDSLEGAGGRDTYKVDRTCEAVSINNNDTEEDDDLLLLNCTNSSLTLRQSMEDLVLSCDLGRRSLDIRLTNWFHSSSQQHLLVMTIDKVSAHLPATISELQSLQGRLLPFQVESDEDCEGQHKVIDLTLPLFQQCEKFVAKTDACSYSIIGNNLDNYIDPGPGNPYGYQHLSGGNGSDTYVIGHRYGLLNVINNDADDEQMDLLLFKALFHNIDVSLHDTDVILHSLYSNDSVKVNILQYFVGESYQHLLVQSADGVLFKIVRDFPYIEVNIVDFSKSQFSQIIRAHHSSKLKHVRKIVGSLMAENYIEGGEDTAKIVGGMKNDTIIGGPGGEDLIGKDGNDVMYGGGGNDVLYGGNGNDTLNGGQGDDQFYPGMGADFINGTSGSNTVIFSGYNYTGVFVDLQVGKGWKADAEGDTYDIINNVCGTQYDDIIVGNSDDNFLKGNDGGDFLVPGGGNDLLLGGRGTDVYFLNDAYGHKAINNFATDEARDLVVLNNTLWENICFHFIGTKLQMSIDFSAVNSSERLSRLLADKTLLSMTLPFWLENDTYQHLGFSFLDTFIAEEDFAEDNHQLLPAIDLISNQSIFEVTSSSPSSVSLSFNYDLTDYTTFDQLDLRLVHTQKNNVTYVTLPLSPPLNYTILRAGLDSGSMHEFFVFLSSCGLIVALSPLVPTSIQPNPPSNILVTESFFNGFKLQWTSPSNETDPFVSDYKYIVRIKRDNQDEESSLKFETTDTVFSIYSLARSTRYRISICSEINAVLCCTSLTTATTSDVCSNLLSLPPHMKVDDFERENMVATLRCDKGYILTGTERVACNDSTPLPRCEAVVCSLPDIPHAYNTEPDPNYYFGDSVEWTCESGYWVSLGVLAFNTTCDDQGSWHPPLQNCSMIPTCPPLTAPQNGSINSSAHPFQYYGDAVSIQCDLAHSLHGPSDRLCTWDDGNETAYWSPSNATDCNAEFYVCPSLLPQTHGIYYHKKQHFYPEDTVLLVCQSGYYIRDDRMSPERVQLSCHGNDWSPSQEQCKPIIETVIQEQLVNSVVISVWYAVPSLRNISVLPRGNSPSGSIVIKASHYAIKPRDVITMACRNVIREFFPPFFHIIRYHGSPVVIQCYRRFALMNGPNSFEGILSVSTYQGNEMVCVERNDSARSVCNKLGYYEYTSSIYHSRDAILTTFQVSSRPSNFSRPSLVILRNSTNCHYRISCRKRCEELPLYHGTGCPRSYEGDSCHVTCNSLYALMGSPSLVCSRTGKWSGLPPICDGEKWKTDVERESRSRRSHGDLTIHLLNYLSRNYPGVDWVVLVYDDVSGPEKHAVYGTNYYHLFRHYGHNIVIGYRIQGPYAPPHNLRATLLNAYRKHQDCICSLWMGTILLNVYRKDCSRSFWMATCTLNAKRTVLDTWKQLRRQGLTPVMLHVARKSITVDVSPFRNGYIVSRIVSGARVTLIVTT